MNLRVNTGKTIDGLRALFSTHVRFGERGAPVDSLQPCLALRVAGLERRSTSGKRARYGAPSGWSQGGFRAISRGVNAASCVVFSLAAVSSCSDCLLSWRFLDGGCSTNFLFTKRRDSISHLTPEAKLLSQKERPVAAQAMDVRPSELPAFPLLPALLMAALTPGLYQAAARYVRTASTEGSRAPLPPCLQAVFLRPPPVLS